MDKSFLPKHRQRLLELHEVLSSKTATSNEIADIIGTTPRHVNRMINLLRKSGAKIGQDPNTFKFGYTEIPDIFNLNIGKF